MPRDFRFIALNLYLISGDIIPHASFARWFPRATINISVDVHSRSLLIACARMHVNSRSYKLQLRGLCSKKLFTELHIRSPRTMRDKSLNHRVRQYYL